PHQRLRVGRLPRRDDAAARRARHPRAGAPRHRRRDLRAAGRPAGRCRGPPHHGAPPRWCGRVHQPVGRLRLRAPAALPLVARRARPRAGLAGRRRPAPLRLVEGRLQRRPVRPVARRGRGGARPARRRPVRRHPRHPGHRRRPRDLRRVLLRQHRAAGHRHRLARGRAGPALAARRPPAAVVGQRRRGGDGAARRGGRERQPVAGRPARRAGPRRPPRRRVHAGARAHDAARPAHRPAQPDRLPAAPGRAARRSGRRGARRGPRARPRPHGRREQHPRAVGGRRAARAGRPQAAHHRARGGRARPQLRRRVRGRRAGPALAVGGERLRRGAAGAVQRPVRRRGVGLRPARERRPDRLAAARDRPRAARAARRGRPRRRPALALGARDLQRRAQRLHRAPPGRPARPRPGAAAPRDDGALPAAGRGRDRARHRLRGAAAVGPPAARARRAGRVRRARRARRDDARGHRLRPRRGAAPDRAVAPAGLDRHGLGQRLRQRPAGPGPAGAGRPSPRAVGRAEHRPRPRAHGDRGDVAPAALPGGHARAPCAARRPVARRLRHGLRLPGLPDDHARRRAQDRQVLRAGHGRQPRRPGGGPLDARAGPLARAARRRGGRRGRRVRRAARHLGLPDGAGLALRPAGAGAGRRPRPHLARGGPAREHCDL
ncbi:MAG: diguanylate cyclase/phosphodiesterase (GGDEF & EAL domains) with PAS/PAC sensor(s), partial [uncultured Frankineae bacterium]